MLESVKVSSKKHWVIVGILLAVMFSFAISLGYLSENGLNFFVAGKVNSDLFAGLAFINEQSASLSDWSRFFSLPFFVGDSNFFVFVHLLIYLVTNNIILSYKLYEVLLFAISFFSMYALAYSLSDKYKELCGVAAGVFYALTPYFLLELVGHIYMMWAYALLPLAYLSIYKTLNNKNSWAWTCVAGILIALVTSYPMIEYIYINGIFLVLFFLLLCFKNARRTELKLLGHKIVRVLIMFSIASLLSVYFIFPMFLLTSPHSIDFAFSRTLAYPVYSNTYIESSFLLNKGFSADLGLNYFNVFGTLMIPFVLPIILSSLLIIINKKSIYMVFFLLGIFGIFFSMGSNAPPFLRFFEYARALPLFSYNRTPCRFTIQVALSFSLLGGIAIGAVLGNLRKLGPRLGKVLKHNYRPKVLGLLLFSAVIIPYLFSGISILYSVAGPFQTQPMPDTTSKVVAWLDDHDPNQDYRVIDLTQTGLVASYHRFLNNGGDIVARFYRSPSFATLLGMLNVKYIITDPDWGQPYFYWHSDINKVLSSSPNFDKVQIDNETIYINNLAKPEIYASYGALTVGGVSALSTFYAAIDGAQLANTNPVGVDNLAFNSGWTAAEVVNTASYGFETQNGTADLWINTTQTWPAYVGYNYDNLDINPNSTRYLVIRLKNDDNPTSATSIHLFDDLNNRLWCVSNVHFSDWTTIYIDLSAYTQRQIKRILIYTVEKFNTSDVKLHTYIDYIAFLNESYQPSIFSNDWALFGTDVLSDENNLSQIKGIFNILVFHDSDLRDLTFPHLDPRLKLEAWKYLNQDWRIVEDHHGSLPSARSYQSSVAGQLVLSERAIYTDKNTTLVVPFSVNNTGSYDIWVRAANTVPIDWCKWADAPLPPTTNVISAGVDGSAVGEADFGKVGGFKWIKINDAPLSLSQGSHLLNLLTSGKPVYLDMIAVTPTGLVDGMMADEMARINNLQHVYLLEFSNYFTGENAIRQASVTPYASDAWSGYLTLEPNSTIAQKLFIAKDGSYVLGLRLLQRPDGGVLTLKIDGKVVINILTRGNNVWKWIKSAPIFLSSGEHLIEVKCSSEGYNSLDLLYIIEESLASHPAVDVAQIQFSEVQLNTWHGNLSSSKPTFLIFTESYYPEWAFQLQDGNNRTSIESLQALYFLNAYHIDSAGSFQFMIQHETSLIRKMSYAVSISTFTICLLIIVLQTLIKRRKSSLKAI